VHLQPVLDGVGGIGSEASQQDGKRRGAAARERT
jgi:hypothetical protein